MKASIPRQSNPSPQIEIPIKRVTVPLRLRKYVNRAQLTVDEWEDVEAAYLLYTVGKRCANCLVDQSPVWRRGWYDALSHSNVFLCNACGLKYLKKQYCPYCCAVYCVGDLGTGAHWIQCQGCLSHCHVKCAQEVLGNSALDKPLRSCGKCENSNNKGN